MNLIYHRDRLRQQDRRRLDIPLKNRQKATKNIGIIDMLST
jgi:hypothetical protein